MTCWENIGNRLVCASQIFLDSYVVLDLEEDDWSGAEDGATEETPVTGEFGHEGDLPGIECPHHGCTGGLDALVETNVVGCSATRVGESTHEPVRFVSVMFAGSEEGDIYQ